MHSTSPCEVRHLGMIVRPVCLPDFGHMALPEGNKIFNVDNRPICTTRNALRPALRDSLYSKAVKVNHISKKHGHDASFVQGKGLIPPFNTGGPDEPVKEGRPGGFKVFDGDQQARNECLCVRSYPP